MSCFKFGGDKMDSGKKDLTWHWFEYHAQQRMSTFYYFLLIIGAISWGYLQCIQGCPQSLILAPFLALLSLWISIGFFYIEVRNVELVNIGRQQLRKEDFQPALIDIADTDNNEELNKLSIPQETKNTLKNEKDKALKDTINCECIFIRKGLIKHEYWLRSIYLLVILYSLSALIYSINNICPAFYRIIFRAIFNPLSDLSYFLNISILFFLVFLFIIILIIYFFWGPWQRKNQ